MPRVVSCGYESNDLLMVNGPAIVAQIGFEPNWVTGNKPAIPAIDYQTLIDTGASESCIDSGTAQTGVY